jgi:hypothetical protein
MWVITPSSIVHWVVVLWVLSMLREQHEPPGEEDWPGWSTSEIAFALVGVFILLNEVIRLALERWLPSPTSSFVPVLLISPVVLPILLVGCIFVLAWFCAFRISWLRASVVGIGLVLLRLGLMRFGPNWMNVPLTRLLGA